MVVIKLIQELPTCFSWVIRNELIPPSISIVGVYAVAKNHVITDTTNQIIRPDTNRGEQRTQSIGKIIKSTDREIAVRRIVYSIQVIGG